MSWRDDISRRRNEIKDVVGIPKDDESKDKEIDEVLSNLWRDAKNYDPRWDAD